MTATVSTTCTLVIWTDIADDLRMSEGIVPPMDSPTADERYADDDGTLLASDEDAYDALRLNVAAQWAEAVVAICEQDGIEVSVRWSKKDAYDARNILRQMGSAVHEDDPTDGMTLAERVSDAAWGHVQVDPNSLPYFAGFYLS